MSENDKRPPTPHPLRILKQRYANTFPIAHYWQLRESNPLKRKVWIGDKACQILALPPVPAYGRRQGSTGGNVGGGSAAGGGSGGGGGAGVEAGKAAGATAGDEEREVFHSRYMMSILNVESRIEESRGKDKKTALEVLLRPIDPPPIADIISFVYLQ